MKIQYISDLHIEFVDNKEWLIKNEILPMGEILLIAGDIVPDKYKHKANFFYEQIGKKFKHIISIMGNHEFYHGMIEYAYPKYKKQMENNFYKINNECIVIGNVRIIGSTLWTQIPPEFNEKIYNKMNDYRLIQKNVYDFKENIQIRDTNNYNKISVKYIENELSKEFNGITILLTHHLPLYNIYEENYTSENDIKFSYSNDLSEIIKKYKIDYWIFGHIHKSVDIKINNTRFLCNPLGYLEEKQYQNFDINKYFEV